MFTSTFKKLLPQSSTERLESCQLRNIFPGQNRPYLCKLLNELREILYLRADNVISAHFCIVEFFVEFLLNSCVFIEWANAQVPRHRLATVPIKGYGWVWDEATGDAPRHRAKGMGNEMPRQRQQGPGPKRPSALRQGCAFSAGSKSIINYGTKRASNILIEKTQHFAPFSTLRHDI